MQAQAICAIRAGAPLLTPAATHGLRSAAFRWCVAPAMIAWFVLAALSGVTSERSLCLAPRATVTDSLLAYVLAGFATVEPIKMAGEWALMIVAMMCPLVIPHVGHVAARSFADQQNSVAGVFLGGYAAVWFAAAAAASIILISIHALLEFLSLGSVAGLIGCLIAATWQISAAKRRALNRCHGTLPLRAFGSAANRDALRFGITQGGRCVASCIPVMVLPLLAGLGFGTMIVLFAILLAERARHTPQFHVSAIVLVLLGLLSVGT